MAEWLRRGTANPLGSARVSSNLIVIAFLIFFIVSKYYEIDVIIFHLILIIKESATSLVDPSSFVANSFLSEISSYRGMLDGAAELFVRCVGPSKVLQIEFIHKQYR